jgi:hypothetical protein
MVVKEMRSSLRLIDPTGRMAGLRNLRRRRQWDRPFQEEVMSKAIRMPKYMVNSKSDDPEFTATMLQSYEFIQDAVDHEGLDPNDSFYVRCW